MAFFESGQFYRHRSFLDVDMYVVGVADIVPLDDKGAVQYNLNIMWTLQRNHDAMIAPELVKVKSEDICNWKLVRA